MSLFVQKIQQESTIDKIARFAHDFGAFRADFKEPHFTHDFGTLAQMDSEISFKYHTKYTCSSF